MNNVKNPGSPDNEASVNPLPQAPKIASMRTHIGASSMRTAGLNVLKGPMQAPTPPSSQQPTTPAKSSQEKEESSSEQPSNTKTPDKENTKKK